MEPDPPPTHTHLVRVLKGHVEVELPQDEQLTLHHAVPQVPELLVTFQRGAAGLEIPAGEQRTRWPLELRPGIPLAALPVAYVDYIPSPEVLLLYLSSQVQTAHGHQVGLVGLQADVLEEAVVKHASCGHGDGAHAQLHP